MFVAFSCRYSCEQAKYTTAEKGVPFPGAILGLVKTALHPTLTRPSRATLSPDGASSSPAKWRSGNNPTLTRPFGPPSPLMERGLAKALASRIALDGEVRSPRPCQGRGDRGEGFLLYCNAESTFSEPGRDVKAVSG